MTNLYRAALRRSKPLCLHDRPTLVDVSLISFGCFLVLFVTATFHHETLSNASLSCVFLEEIMIGGALKLLGSFYQTLQVERVAARRAQRGEARES